MTDYYHIKHLFKKEKQKTIYMHIIFLKVFRNSINLCYL